MMLELHNVTIEPLIRTFSLTVEDGKLACVTGDHGSGKTPLLRAILGFIPIHGGHISIDGELLSPQSAPYFRRMTAYVPQHLSLPEGYDERGLERWNVLTAEGRYLLLLNQAVRSGKPLLLVDEPPLPVSEDTALAVERLLVEATQHGTTVLAVNSRITQNQIRL